VRSEAEVRADFASLLRYAQCWEDADILVDGLDVQPGHTCVSIASAGENSFSLLSAGPKKVIAIDLNPAQLAAVELRIAAYRVLSHAELLELIGSRLSERRPALYARCRDAMPVDARAFWDAKPDEVAGGVGSAGKFERYFRTFRRRVLPLVHRRRAVRDLLTPKNRDARAAFFDSTWNSWAWRLLFRVFFSERLLGFLGRDPSFFKYAEEPVAEMLMKRVRHAFVELDPAANPYLTWIMTGMHGVALPHALRAENFDAIRANLDRLEVRRSSLEELDARDGSLGPIDRWNLSDIFEYMSDGNAKALFGLIADRSRAGSRLAYWNMIVPRRGASYLPDRLRGREEESTRLFAQDKAFFYRAFVVEDVC
jgi:S-adenosylmethionine-diacylglycerol 3-amino-3-carboxypropyl transferase